MIGYFTKYGDGASDITPIISLYKLQVREIAKYLGIEGVGAYVRVSQLKRQAVNKLIENVDHSQVLDYL